MSPMVRASEHLSHEVLVEFIPELEGRIISISKECRRLAANVLREALIKGFNGAEEAQMQHANGVETFVIPNAEQFLDFTTFVSTGEVILNTKINIVKAHVLLPSRDSENQFEMDLVLPIHDSE